MNKRSLSPEATAVIIAHTMFRQSLEGAKDHGLSDKDVLAIQASIASVFICLVAANITGGRENQKQFWDITKNKLDEEFVSIIEVIEKMEKKQCQN